MVLIMPHNLSLIGCHQMSHLSWLFSPSSAFYKPCLSTRGLSRATVVHHLNVNLLYSHHLLSVIATGGHNGAEGFPRRGLHHEGHETP